MKIKKLVFVLVLLLVPFISLQSVHADSNDFEKLTMLIHLNVDGSATIEETWKMTTVTATENYKVYDNMGDAYIKDYTVSDESGSYQYVENWDIDASRQEKTNKYGIVEDGDRYELCYGIGEYGYHTYTMKYTIVNFIDQYEDIQALNCQLVSADLDPMPKAVEITISSFKTLDHTTTDIYAFGFDGFINFTGGNIYVTNLLTDGSYGRVNYVNVLSGFRDSPFSGGNTQYNHQTFNEILEDAKTGSNYGDDEIPTWVIILIFVIFIVIIVGVVEVILMDRYRGKHYFTKLQFTDGNNLLPKKTEVDPFRDIPCQKDIFYFYYVTKKSGILSDNEQGKSGIMAAILLTWIRNGDIEFVKTEGGFFNKNKYEISFKKDIKFKNKSEQDVYTFFKEAAGANGILEAKEFERWCKVHYARIEAWFSQVDIYQHNLLTGKNLVKNETTYRKYLGIEVPSVKDYYTPEFRDEILHSAGLKNFLLEFSSIEEKQVKEVALWEEYLIFASILGIADKVEKELGRLYPEFNQQSRLDTSYTTFATRAFIYNGIHNSNVASNAAKIRASGGGGGSSFGGGGGSFHGGGGGGSR